MEFGPYRVGPFKLGSIADAATGIPVADPRIPNLAMDRRRGPHRGVPGLEWRRDLPVSCPARKGSRYRVFGAGL